MKKRRTKKKTAVVVSGISSKLEKAQKKSEPAPAKSREAVAATPPAAKVWKWARRVVLGYDRNP